MLEKSIAVMSSRRVALFVGAVAVALLLLLPWPAAAATAAEEAAAANVALPGCTSKCGNMSIPHPFGVERGCYLPGFNVTCRNSSLFLGDGTVEVLAISIPNATVQINATYTYFPSGSNGTRSGYFADLGPKPITNGTWSGALEDAGVYTAARLKNRMFVVGCNVQVFLLGEWDTAAAADDIGQTLGACSTSCVWEASSKLWMPLNYLLYCEAEIAIGIFYSSYRFKVFGMNNGATGGPAYGSSDAIAWILDSRISIEDTGIFAAIGDDYPLPMRRLPALLEWGIKHTTCYANGSSAACRSKYTSCRNNTVVAGPRTHNCFCDEGYQGNPYVPNGCTDVNECNDPNTYPCYGICNNTEGSYQCKCPPGFVGNASLPNGCKDINECAHPDSYPCYGVCTNMPGTYLCQCKRGSYGDPFTKRGCQSVLVWLGVGGGMMLLLLALGVPFIARKIKQHKVKMTKERFFKQNHGILLQQLVSQKSDIGGRMILTLGELEKATNNFDPSHEIGGGGHGIVYKGLLDLQVVAIKKSKIIVQKEIDDFINEVVILSQINHRNIVKLLGCCLETEVPLLVYEFISNSTLAHHLHVEGKISLPWDDRMRIALETSKALAYLHSAASTPVLHRDIKSSNILLDDNLTAKLSDFGASRYISIDQTGVTTAIQGTIGYLDPMYYYTSRLTDKSDVYSFGVLLIELLTRKKPTMQTTDGDSLVSHFASLIADGDLFGIIDPQIKEKAEVEKVEEVAKLAAMCTKLNGEGRPTMREVEMTLENLRTTEKHTHYNIATERYEKDQIVGPYFSIEGLNMESSRQYTMEKEILLSGAYPR